MLTVGVRSHDYGKDQPDALFSRIAKDGYQAVMLAYQKAIDGVNSYYDVTPSIIESTKTALKNHGLSINTLGVYMELGLAEETKRQEAVKQFLKGIDTAQQMGVANVATETTPFHKQPNVSPKEALKALYRSLEQILPAAQQARVTVCVEPVYYHTLSSAPLTKQLLKDFATPWLKVTYDPVNLLQANDEPCQKDLWDTCFEAFGEQIEVVHMKGIRFENGEPVNCGFGDSIVDYPYLFRQLKSLKKPLHIIRERAQPQLGKQEVAFLEALCKE